MPPIVDRCVDLRAWECLYYNNYKKKETKIKECLPGFNFISGAVQLEHARELLNAHPCGFRPAHHNKLGNEFMLFTNYDPQERLGGWEKT